MTRTPQGRSPQHDRDAAARDEAVARELAEVYEEILDRAPEHDLEPSLDRIAAVTSLLGDPQRAFRVVHVTGTNGKTSTARMIERLLSEHGLRTGRFTSPHLVEMRERIVLDGEPLPAQRFVEVYREVLPYLDLVDARSDELDRPRLSFFEVLVAMAYAAFADAPVDVAVIEVGMGGSWDATNVADGEVAVVTPISLDHQDYLGPDLASIAGEKAGILKPGAVAVLAEQPAEAVEPLLRRAAEVGATVAREGLEFGVASRQVAVGGQVLTVQGLAAQYPDLFLPLHGEHQARNAACAVAAVEALLGTRPAPGHAGFSGGLEPELVRAGLAEVTSPGRLELIRRSPAILLDAAHNPAGAAALAAAVEESFAVTRLIGVVGVLGDKDALGILEALQPILDEVVVTRSSSPRSIPPEQLAELAADVFGEERVTVAERLDAAIEAAVTLAEQDGVPGGGVLIAGSVTLAGDARRLLGRRR